MTLREFLGYALGTAFVLAVSGAVVGSVILLVGAIPLMLALFPITAALVGGIVLIGWLRHRRQRRRNRRDSA